MLNNMFIIKDIDFMLNVWDLAKSRGKKAGDNIQTEFEEMTKLHPEMIEFLGKTESDVDLMAGEIRDQNPNIKVLNINEINRRLQNEK